jgi:hypothetical protein
MPVLKREAEIFSDSIFAMSDPAWVALLATATLLALGSFVAPAQAQLATDEVPRERIVPRSEEIRHDLEESRYHIGPLRFRPLFGIRDFGYDNNVFGTPDQPVADWQSTVSAGADVILPLGRKMYATGIINPEYTYYQKLADRRLLGGEYGASLVALFNRLSIEAGGTTDKAIAPVNSEIERPAPGTLNDLFARSELEIFRRLSVFGSMQEQRQRYQLTESDRLQGINLEQLERNETFVRAGIRYRPRSFFDFSVAAETGHTEFVSARQSDNNTHAVILGIHYDRPRLYLNLSVGKRTGDARGPLSTFPAFSTTTGSYFALYQLGPSLAIDAYGHRAIAYGLYIANPYYVETRTGLGLTLPVGQRLGLRGFGEVGSNDYPIASGGIKRTDDVTVVGGGIAYRLYRKVIVTITASDTRYDSSIAGYGRSIFRLTSVLSLRGDSFR